MDAANVALLVAGADLKMVQLITGAMRAVDGKQSNALINPGPTIEPRQHIHPTPEFESRPIIHPTPRFEPRPVYHPTPRLEPRLCPPCPPQDHHKHSDVLPPPWKQPIWAMPAPVQPKIKIVQLRPDILHKGTLIDCFI